MTTDKPSDIANAWLTGPRDDYTTYKAMQAIAEHAELLEDLLDDCLTVLDCATDGDAAEFAAVEAARIRCEAQGETT